MKVLLLPLFLAAGVWSQSCTNDFSAFLRCVGNQLDTNYRSFEEEYQSDVVRLVETCFNKPPRLATDRYCLLDPQGLYQPLESSDLLKSCSICKVATKLVTKAFSTTTATEIDCIKTELVEAFKRELLPCMQSKLGSDFQTPEIPDFNGGIHDIKSDLLKTTEMVSNMLIRLDGCKNRSPSEYAATDACINTYKSQSGPFCQLVGGCKTNSVSGQCTGAFGTAKQAMCQCINEMSAEAKSKVQGIANQIRQAVSQRSAPDAFCLSQGISDGAACSCVSSIRAALKTRNNDWLEVTEGMLSKCLPQSNMNLNKLLNLGCVRGLKLASGLDDLEKVFTFVNVMLEAVAHRATRFCRESCI